MEILDILIDIFFHRKLIFKSCIREYFLCMKLLQKIKTAKKPGSSSKDFRCYLGSTSASCGKCINFGIFRKLFISKILILIIWNGNKNFVVRRPVLN